MATPNVNSQEAFGPVNGGDILHFKNMAGMIVSWIDGQGFGQGNLTSGGTGSGYKFEQHRYHRRFCEH